MRLIQLFASCDNAEAYKKVTDKLKEDYGEPIITQRSGIIKPEEGAFEKLKRLQSGTFSN